MISLLCPYCGFGYELKGIGKPDDEPMVKCDNCKRIWFLYMLEKTEVSHGTA